MFGITRPSQNPFSFNTLVFLPSLPTCSCPLSPISIITSKIQTPAIDLSKLKMEHPPGASRGLQGSPGASRGLQKPSGWFFQRPSGQGPPEPPGASKGPPAAFRGAGPSPGTSGASRSSLNPKPQILNPKP